MLTEAGALVHSTPIDAWDRVRQGKSSFTRSRESCPKIPLSRDLPSLGKNHTASSQAALRPLINQDGEMSNQTTSILRRVFSAGLIAVSVGAVIVTRPAASDAATCPPPPSPLQPFAPWSDTNDYVLTTGGSFEPGTAGWSLSGGATLVVDNAPNALDPATDSKALYLPAGSTATSPCVTAPKILGIVRFFAKGIDTTGELRVEVLVKGKVYQAGSITSGSNWQPSPMLVSNAPAYKGAVTYQVRVIATGGDFTVDDVYFDPYSSK